MKNITPVLTGKKWLAKIGDEGAKSQLFFVLVESSCYTATEPKRPVIQIVKQKIEAANTDIK